MKDFVNKFKKKKNISEDILRKIDKKTFVMFSRFWPLRGGGGGLEVESLKKGKLETKK